MSQSQLDLQIISKLEDLLNTDKNPTIVKLSDQLCVNEEVVSVKRDVNKSTGMVVSIKSVFKQIQDGIVYIRIQPVSHLGIDISSILVTCPELDLNDVKCDKSIVVVTNDKYTTKVYKSSNGYTVRIKSSFETDEELHMTFSCVDSLGHKSNIYEYVTDISTNAIPTILSPMINVYGTSITALIDNTILPIDEVQWMINNGINTRTVISNNNYCSIDITDDILDTSPSITNRINIIKTAGSEDAISCICINKNIISISPSGKLHKTTINGSAKLPTSDKFPTNTTILDMIEHSSYGGIVLTHRSTGLNNVYALYSIDSDGRIIHITDIATEYVPVKLNKHSVLIDGMSYLGVCCIDGVVLWFDKNINLVQRDKFLADRVNVDSRLVVPSVCMLNNDLVVSYRYGYEVYSQNSMGDYTLIHHATDLGHPWLSFSNKFSNLLSDGTRLIYSTNSGVYTSTDGITWKRCSDAIFTSTVPNSTIRLMTKKTVDDITYYYGCLTNDSPYPLGIVVTTDLVKYIYIPLELNCSSNIPIMTITGRGIWLPSYKIFLYERCTPITLSVKYRINNKWSDTSSKTINVIW